ncbi:hypothetical protein CAOG_009568 [Capsaspora owczarzaki ATCC 30864]|uniref:Uncharacterized protein n=1 Tax=Capsaspora owczarzaki (strain ATCC 30864) TaxID=595528 RepID=A0A0D2WMN6_CAPO3|nr:hypothetical protein CAOG_009568 [Capsaspora owczarzaki ATCC 30864]
MSDADFFEELQADYPVITIQRFTIQRFTQACFCHNCCIIGDVNHIDHMLQLLFWTKYHARPHPQNVSVATSSSIRQASTNS